MWYGNMPKGDGLFLGAEDAPGGREVGPSWEMMGCEVERAVWVIGDGEYRRLLLVGQYSDQHVLNPHTSISLAARVVLIGVVSNTARTPTEMRLETRSCVGIYYASNPRFRFKDYHAQSRNAARAVRKLTGEKNVHTWRIQHCNSALDIYDLPQSV